jgi:hypothetical protein
LEVGLLLPLLVLRQCNRWSHERRLRHPLLLHCRLRWLLLLQNALELLCHRSVLHGRSMVCLRYEPGGRQPLLLPVWPQGPWLHASARALLLRPRRSAGSSGKCSSEALVL